MKVTDQDVAHVADLANLELTGEERAHLLRDLNSILQYVERLRELNTDDVAVMAQFARRPVAANDVLQREDGREDVKDGLRKSLPHEVAVSNAPDTDGIFFKVPKVIER